MSKERPLTIVSFIVVLSNGSTLTLGKDHTTIATQHFGSGVCKTEELIKKIKPSHE